MPENHIVILCTVPDQESGEKIAEALVEERLAACVNLLPGVVSTYRWEGAVKQDQELLLLIKTSGARFEAVNEGMQVQSTGAEQITQALSQLSETTHQTAESLRQSSQAIERLNEAAAGLRAGASRFVLEK